MLSSNRLIESHFSGHHSATSLVKPRAFLVLGHTLSSRTGEGDLLKVRYWAPSVHFQIVRTGITLETGMRAGIAG